MIVNSPGGWADKVPTALTAATGASSSQLSAATTVLTPANAVVPTAGPGASVSPLGQSYISETQMRSLYPVGAIAPDPALASEILRQATQLQTAYRI
jgi:hypothetical protein